MAKLQIVIDRAQIERTDVKILQEGAKAQELHSVLRSLCATEKYRSVQEIQNEINNLTIRLDSMNVIKDKIPIVQKLKNLEAQLELKGVNQNDGKVASSSIGSTGHADSCVLENAFYKKLVEVDSDDIVFKAYNLALLVSDVHQVKVFYAFLNHLFRSNRISKDDRQRCTLKVLQETSRTICKSSCQLKTMQGRIIQKCRDDGILLHGIDEHDADSVTSTEPSLPSLASSLAMIEFRVGEMLARTSTQSQVTANTPNESVCHPAILTQVQAVGRSLKDFQVALE